jgi:hypothetical protein
MRLWVRRRPVLTVVALTVVVIGAFYLSSALTSVFSPVH